MELLTIHSDTEPVKYCGRCERDLPLSMFYLLKGKPQSPCKECRKKQGHDSYQKKIEAHPPKFRRLSNDDVDDGFKRCCLCRNIQPLTEYYRGKKWKDGLYPRCKMCVSESGKKDYERECQQKEPKNRKRPSDIVHDYFSHVDSPLSAYLLGLLASDGYVLKAPIYRIGLELSVNDESLVSLFKDNVAPKRKVRRLPARENVVIMGRQCDSTDVASLTFTSRKMAEDLSLLGVVPNKSLVIQWPHTLSNTWTTEFLLGYFDGNGHVTISRHGDYRYPRVGMCSGSPEFLKSAADFIGSSIGFTPSVNSRGSDIKCWSIAVTGEKAYQLDRLLHRSGLGLERKRVAALDFS